MLNNNHETREMKNRFKKKYSRLYISFTELSYTIIWIIWLFEHTHSSTLAWKIPWREDPGGLQSMGSLRVRHDGATSLSLFTFVHWRRKWQPTPMLLPGECQGHGSLVGCFLGVAQSRTWLKRLSSSSSSRSLYYQEHTQLPTNANH